MDKWSHPLSGPSGTPWTGPTLSLVPLAHHGLGFAGPTLSLVPLDPGFAGPTLSLHNMDPGFAGPTLSLVPLTHHGPRVCWSHPLSGPSGTPWTQGLLVPPSLWFLWHTMDPGFAGPTLSLVPLALHGHGFAGPTLSLVPLAHHGPRVCWSHPLSGPSGTPWTWVCWSHPLSGPSGTPWTQVPLSLWSLWHIMDPGFAGPTLSLVPLAHHGHEYAGPTPSLIPLAHHGPRVCWSHPLSGASGTP